MKAVIMAAGRGERMHPGQRIAETRRGRANHWPTPARTDVRGTVGRCPGFVATMIRVTSTLPR